MWPFTRKSAMERKLLLQHAKMLEAWGIPKQTAKEALVVVKQQARSDPDLPPNFGQLLLERELTDDSIKHMLAPKRVDGVTDEDIKWWWGLSKLERRLLIMVDDCYRMAAYSKYLDEGMSKEQATAQLRKCFPIFGDPENTKNVIGDDRALPYELKNRVNKWIENKAIANGLPKLQKSHAISSMNALIRNEIRTGML